MLLTRTAGMVSNHEQQPIAGEVLQTFLVTGPMSRFCCDLLPMYRILVADNIDKLKLDVKVCEILDCPFLFYTASYLLLVC